MVATPARLPNRPNRTKVELASRPVEHFDHRPGAHARHLARVRRAAAGKWALIAGSIGGIGLLADAMAAEHDGWGGVLAFLLAAVGVVAHWADKRRERARHVGLVRAVPWARFWPILLVAAFGILVLEGAFSGGTQVVLGVGAVATAAGLALWHLRVHPLAASARKADAGARNELAVARMLDATGTRVRHKVVAVAGNGHGGFWEATESGAVHGFDGAPQIGPSRTETAPVAIASTPDGKGFWLLTENGEVGAWGNAIKPGQPRRFFTGPGTTTITAAPDGGFYAASVGGLVLAKDGARRLPQPTQALRGIVGMALNPSGPGYFLVASNCRVFPEGGAPRPTTTCKEAPTPPSLPRLRVPDRTVAFFPAKGTVVQVSADGHFTPTFSSLMSKIRKELAHPPVSLLARAAAEERLGQLFEKFFRIQPPLASDHGRFTPIVGAAALSAYRAVIVTGGGRRFIEHI